MGIESSHIVWLRHSVTNNSVISLRPCYNTGLLPQMDINLQLCTPLAQLYFKGGFHPIYVNRI